MPATKRAAARQVPASTEPIPVKADVETWQNETNGIVAVNRVGEYGRKLVDLIHGGRRFQITPQERRMNQNAAHSPDLDVFTNGTLRPIDLLDDEPDSERLRDNPNIVAESELPAVFRLKGERFNQRIGTITNPAAIARLVELARDPRYDATLAQYEILKRRELELKGELDRERDPQSANRDNIPRGVTPR